MRSRKDKKQSGNILFIILMAIALLALLTGIISNTSDQQSDIISRQTMSDQVSRMLNHISVINTALVQIILNGESEKTLYSSLSTLKPGDVDFDAPPHHLKLYHPLGGGVKYATATTNNPAEAMVTNYNINKASIITGVGRTDSVIGDIIFTASVATQEYCAYINKKILQSAVVPVMNGTAFNALFVNNTTITIDAANCAGCVNAPRMCVSNDTNTAWSFYAALLPQ